MKPLSVFVSAQRFVGCLTALHTVRLNMNVRVHRRHSREQEALLSQGETKKGEVRTHPLVLVFSIGGRSAFRTHGEN